MREFLRAVLSSFKNLDNDDNDFATQLRERDLEKKMRSAGSLVLS